MDDGISTQKPDFLNRIGRKQTSCWLNADDWQWCKSHHLMFSVLLSQKIAELRNIDDGVTTNDILKEREKREKFQSMLDNAVKFIRDRHLIEEWVRQNGS
jgi:hypothetical protein